MQNVHTRISTTHAPIANLCVLFVDEGRQGSFHIYNCNGEDPETMPTDVGCSPFLLHRDPIKLFTDKGILQEKIHAMLLILFRVKFFSKKALRIILGWDIQEVSSIGNDFKIIIFSFFCQRLSIHDKKLKWGIQIQALRSFCYRLNQRTEAKIRFL